MKVHKRVAKIISSLFRSLWYAQKTSSHMAQANKNKKSDGTFLFLFFFFKLPFGTTPIIFILRTILVSNIKAHNFLIPTSV